MDYYDEFGVSHTASPQEIRASYKKLVRLVHPDLCSDPELRLLAELQTARLNAILATLLDPAERLRYDSTLTANPPKPKTRKIQARWYWWPIALLPVICLLPGERQQPLTAAATIRPQAQPLKTSGTNGPRRNYRPVPPRAASSVAPAMSIETPIVLPLVQPEPSDETSPAQIDPAPLAWVSDPAVTGPVLTGDWLFVPSPGSGDRESYPPEYIELRLTGNSGVLKGRYRARYRIGDRAISPTVAFEFAGPASGDRVSLSWTGSGGARGDIELRLLANGALEVTWTARSLGTELGLISGSAVLVRKSE